MVASELERYDVGTFDDWADCGGDPHAHDAMHRWRRDLDNQPGWVRYRCHLCGALEDYPEEDEAEIW